MIVHSCIWIINRKFVELAEETVALQSTYKPLTSQENINNHSYSNNNNNDNDGNDNYDNNDKNYG